jgi:hypothetical protein
MKYLSVAFVFAMSISVTKADEVVVGNEASPWLWSISVGAMNWQDLGKVESRSGGNFDELGIGFELAGHRRVSNWHNANVLLGVDLGFFSADSDIRGTYSDLTQRGLYLTPSIKLAIGEPARLYLEAGAGWYNVDFSEFDCTIFGLYCLEPIVPFTANTLGGYLGLRAQLGRMAFVGLRVHHADFGQVSGIDSAATDLKGPFYILSIGAGF